MDEDKFDDRTLAKKIKAIDAARKRDYEATTHLKWGDPETNDMILNASRHTPKELAQALTGFVKTE